MPRCPVCQSGEPDSARFCTQCGAQLRRSGWASALAPQGEDGRWVIGRQGGVDVELESPIVSARHLLLELEGGQWFATDLGSRNGSAADGRPIGPQRAPIEPLATLTLGTLTLTGAIVDTARRRRIAAPTQRELVVGSAPGSDMLLDDPTVSPRHAALRRTEAGWLIRDLGSYGGTRVNGQRLRGEALLRPGDRVELGHLRLEPEGPGFRGLDLSRELRLDVQGLSLRDAGGATLLHDLRFSVQPGELVMVFGPTGAGKTTLLRVLAGAVPPSAGSVRVNGVSVYENLDFYAGIIGLVPQGEVLPRRLSAREVLRYAARLHLPPEVAEARAEALLDRLELRDCAEARVQEGPGGLSGGQRKRLNIGVELVASPALLLLDEPTSGLDARAAMHLMRLARRLADEGRPVILSVHQPRIEAFELADAVMVLTRGRLAYFGPPGELEATLRPLLPGAAHPRANPADLALDALEAPPGQEEAVAEGFAARFRASPVYARWVEARLAPVESTQVAAPPPSLPALGVLTRRGLAVMAADRRELALLLAQAPVVGALVLALFGGLRFLWVPIPGVPPRDELSPALFLFATAMLWLGCNNACREVVRERALFERERRQGVSALSWLGSKVIAQLLIALGQAAVLALFAVGMGMPHGAEVFAVLTLTGWVGASMGLMLSSYARSEQIAVMMVPMIVLPQIALGGLIVSASDMPHPLREIADVMVPLRASFEALALLQLPERMGGVLRLETLGMAHRALPLPPWNARLWLGGVWTVLPLLLAERRLR